MFRKERFISIKAEMEKLEKEERKRKVSEDIKKPIHIRRIPGRASLPTVSHGGEVPSNPELLSENDVQNLLGNQTGSFDDKE